ncbi:MAG: type II secretion system protein [Candidatus Andersenbacteria bacterium]|nr:type II secretion system protein [Candidatus Andersenbacteria bacterium]
MLMCMNLGRKRQLTAGFTLIELLVVIAIIWVLATLILSAIGASRTKAFDSRIRSSVGQIRWLAESVYDTQGANYTDWAQHATIQQNLALLLEDIDFNYGDDPGAPYVTALRESQIQDYCISAPLRTEPGKYYCIDNSGVFKTTDAACPDELAGGAPLVCP